MHFNCALLKINAVFIWVYPSRAAVRVSSGASLAQQKEQKKFKVFSSKFSLSIITLKHLKWLSCEKSIPPTTGSVLCRVICSVVCKVRECQLAGIQTHCQTGD